MKVVMTGATGLIGRRVAKRLLAEGNQLVVLTRNSRSAAGVLPEADLVSWDAISDPPPSRFLEGADAVIHLSGENVAGGRWTKQRKEAIRDSRVIGTRNIVHSILECRVKPKVLLSGSAIGFYGDRGDEELDESSAAGEGFLAEVGKRWEGEAQSVAESGETRLVCLRTGIVLSSSGGALPRIAGPIRKFVGGVIGDGRQWMSWIHIDDEVEAVLFLLRTESAKGVYNLTSPNPVTNREFTKTLAGQLRRPALFPAPAFILRMFLREMAQELLLKGQRVLPGRLTQAGFQFGFEELRPALADLLE